MAAVDTALLNK